MSAGAHCSLLVASVVGGDPSPRGGALADGSGGVEHREDDGRLVGGARRSVAVDAVVEQRRPPLDLESAVKQRCRYKCGKQHQRVYPPHPHVNGSSLLLEFLSDLAPAAERERIHQQPTRDLLKLFLGLV